MVVGMGGYVRRVDCCRRGGGGPCCSICTQAHDCTQHSRAWQHIRTCGPTYCELK